MQIRTLLRLLPLLSLAALLAPPAAPALAAKHPAASACKAPRVLLRAGRRTTCVKPARGGAPTQAATLRGDAAKTARRTRAARRAARRLAPLRRLHDGPRMRRLQRSLDARFASQALTAVAAAANPRSSGGGERCAQPFEERMPIQTMRRAGVTHTGSGGIWGAGRGPVSGTEVTHRASDGATTMSRTTVDCISWDVCPIATGAVDGRAVQSWEERRVAELRGVGSIVSVVRVVTTAELDARAGADARAGRFDVVADTVVQYSYEERLANGRLAGRTPTRTYRLHSVQRGLNPRAAGDGGSTELRTARGPKGDRFEGDTGAALAGADGMAQDAIRRDGARNLLEAERNWYDRMACARLVLTPASTTVRGGERVQAEARLAAQDGAAVTGTYAITGGFAEGGSGRLPGGFSFTVPQAADGRYAGAIVLATSPAGRAQTDLSVEIANERRFAVEVAGTHRYQWSMDGLTRANIGTDSECTWKTEGAGLDAIVFATRAGERPTALLRGDRLEISGGAGFATLAAREGHKTVAKTGPAPGCGGTETEAAAGCRPAAVPIADLQPTYAWESGRLRLQLSDHRQPDYTPCPLDQPAYGRPLDTSLIDAIELALPLERLRAGGAEPIVVSASIPLRGMEDCGSEDGPGCTNDGSWLQQYAIEATKTLDVTVTLRPL